MIRSPISLMSVTVLAYLVGLFLLFSQCVYSQPSSNPSRSPVGPRPDSITASHSRVYEIKKELLFSEIQMRADAAGISESILHQTRAAIVTLLVGFLAYLLVKGDKHLIWWVVAFSLIFVLCMYATDSFFTDLQDRSLNRLGEVNRLLNALPTMPDAQLAAIETFPRLDIPDPVRKFCLLFTPKYVHVLAYIPPVLILAFMVYRASTTKK